MADTKKYFKNSLVEKISSPLKEFNFKFYDKLTIGRMTSDEIFQSISFTKSPYDTYFFNAHFTIRPMYCPNEDYFVTMPGNSFIALTKNKKEFWNYTTETNCDESFNEISEIIMKIVLPIFDLTTNSNQVISSYEKNIFGQRKFGNKIEWGTIGWENFDIGHIYLRAGNRAKAINQLKKSYKIFKSDDRDWAKIASERCLELIELIDKDNNEIENYIRNVIETSKANLKLDNW